MNHLIFLDGRAGELEKILSGVKTMVVNEVDPARDTSLVVSQGDSLYFLRNSDDCALQVKATAVRVLFFTDHSEEEIPHILKEMQPRLQLTEDQYNYWSAKRSVMLVEFDRAHKIGMIQVALSRLPDCSRWITFEAFSKIT